jgi:Ca-activated chloride channel family protein
MARLLRVGFLVVVASQVATSLATADVPVFEAGVDLVFVTVSVRDPAGHVVSGLGVDDFVLLEDGRPRKIALVASAASEGTGDATGAGDDSLALDVGILFDTSETMANEIQRAQESVLRFLEAIPRVRDLLVVFFDSDIRISRYTHDQQQGLIARILDTEGAGYTALYDAIIAYVSRVDDIPGRKALVLFTDGEDTTSETSVKEMFDVVRSAGVTVYPVSFADGAFAHNGHRGGAARALLSQLAKASGGEVFSPRSSKDLPGVYARILEDLGGQYVVGFAPEESKKPGWRKLKVELSGSRKGYRVRYRDGFVPEATMGK